MKTLLERGVCSRYHKISSEADIWVETKKNSGGGATGYMRCRECRRMIDRKSQAAKRDRDNPDRRRNQTANKIDEARLVELSCSHHTPFKPPVPVLGDLIWCVRCPGEAKVEKLGRFLEVSHEPD